ncbi:MAG: DNA translocase FtsK 4TM domain-containing protein, partial [Alphaproteobacteria bacterium]|nr:DNA translocase FtsK 4TM domain-containing protein [Alphaproteobacteria bacterium]
MAASRRTMSVYQPRSRKAAFADALADARRAVARALKIALLRGAGGLVFLAACAGLLALATFNATDPSLDHATGSEAANWLGGFGATAADLMLRMFGIAALAFLTPPAVWGAKAMTGRSIAWPIWRAAAWPLGTALVAGGLGILPGLEALPAGTGGLFGLAIAGLSRHAALAYHHE